MPRVAASFPHASVVVTPGTTTLQLTFLPSGERLRLGLGLGLVVRELGVY